MQQIDDRSGAVLQPAREDLADEAIRDLATTLAVKTDNNRKAVERVERHLILVEHKVGWLFIVACSVLAIVALHLGVTVAMVLHR
ncbi:MAG: hypothetical protein HOV80_17620 [Polyangiaceae bacterium]|nr:hypothetical protein [Polyangiaceae bacterium]